MQIWDHKVSRKITHIPVIQSNKVFSQISAGQRLQLVCNNLFVATGHRAVDKFQRVLICQSLKYFTDRDH